MSPDIILMEIPRSLGFYARNCGAWVPPEVCKTEAWCAQQVRKNCTGIKVLADAAISQPASPGPARRRLVPNRSPEPVLPNRISFCFGLGFFFLSQPRLLLFGTTCTGGAVPGGGGGEPAFSPSVVCPPAGSGWRFVFGAGGG